MAFFEEHLLDVDNNREEKTFELIFAVEVPVEIVDEIRQNGLISNIGNVLKFNNIYNLSNHDVGKTISEIDKALRTEKSPIPIATNYLKIIKELLNVNDIYSVLLEVILSNLYVNSQNVIYRYQDSSNREIAKKYSVYHVSTMISPLLAMLYTPNNITMSNLTLDADKDISEYSILERLWLQTK